MATSPNRQQHNGPVVAAQGLTKVFKDFWMRSRARAVDRLSFEIEPKEIFGLLGPNGSGKSTTIKMILGLLRPSAGRVAVFGRPPTDVNIKKRIGYLPEESYLYGFLNARETLDYYAKLFSIPHRVRAKRVDELLDMVGLTGAQFRPVREYSKGMQRRIGIAQALINDPDFLILDEPTTGLDPIGTRQVKDLILRLGERGKTVLLSSHLLADVEDVVDRMVILYGGQKREEGTCDELLVAHHRTTIETDALDDATISEIDEIIRRRSGGLGGVVRISHPHQTLEEKFLDIVQRAREERAETSGAETGEMAEFLKGPAEGEGLIEQLVTAGDAEELPPPEVESADDRRRQRDEGEPDASLIEGLVAPAAEEAPAPGAPATEHDRRDNGDEGVGERDGDAQPRPAPAPRRQDVDVDVIATLEHNDDEEPSA